MKRIAIGLIAGVAVVSVLLALAVVFGGPQPPPPMESINAPFRSVDLSDLALLKRYTARDGARLAFRAYAPTASPAKGSAVLIHGSSASSSSLHPLAKGLAQAGYAVYALDMRGHGESGPKGQITYIGQLEDDVEDFLEAVQPAGPRTLVGLSAGGGFALRFAASSRQQPFDQYVLLAPFIHRDAPTYRPGVWRMGRSRGCTYHCAHVSQPFRDHPVQHFAGACFCVDGRSAAVLNAYLLLCPGKKLSSLMTITGQILALRSNRFTSWSVKTTKSSMPISSQPCSRRPESQFQSLSCRELSMLISRSSPRQSERLRRQSNHFVTGKVLSSLSPAARPQAFRVRGGGLRA